MGLGVVVQALSPAAAAKVGTSNHRETARRVGVTEQVSVRPGSFSISPVQPPSIGTYVLPKRLGVCPMDLVVSDQHLPPESVLERDRQIPEAGQSLDPARRQDEDPFVLARHPGHPEGFRIASRSEQLLNGLVCLRIDHLVIIADRTDRHFGASATAGGGADG